MKAEEILKSKGITGKTQFHSYEYLYKSIIKSMDEYADIKVKEALADRSETQEYKPICGYCHHKLTEVRPGKYQCDWCNPQ